MKPITMTTDPHGSYPTPAELRGLADRARIRGVRIVGTPERPQAFDPDTTRTHDLTAVSCSCRMFVACGACQHHALFVLRDERRRTGQDTGRMPDRIAA